jgi:hypothetical protein
MRIINHTHRVLYLSTPVLRYRTVPYYPYTQLQYPRVYVYTVPCIDIRVSDSEILGENNLTYAVRCAQHQTLTNRLPISTNILPTHYLAPTVCRQSHYRSKSYIHTMSNVSNLHVMAPCSALYRPNARSHHLYPEIASQRIVRIVRRLHRYDLHKHQTIDLIPL